MIIGSSEFKWGFRTYLMGIINVTPDSFSGDGVMARGGNWVSSAILQGVQMVRDGADILDVGGESTRPGGVPVSAQEELERVIPVIEELAKQVSVPISIDTYKSDIAQHAIVAGASIINDVWAGKMDQKIFDIAAKSETPIILMHNRNQSQSLRGDASRRRLVADVTDEKLGARYVGVQYGDLLRDIKNDLQGSIKNALEAGVSAERIIVDPGIGFGKTVEQNLELIERLDELKELGYPILVGPSRKSFIGYTLDVPPEERLEGTAAAVAICIERGADIIRVHDTKEMRRAAKIADAIVRRRVRLDDM